MKGNLKEALDNVDMLYEQLIDIANDMVKSYSKDMDTLISTASENIGTFTNSALQDLMLRISLMSFTFGEIKEKALSKAACAEYLRKERYAEAFIAAEGAIAVKENNATLNISDAIISEAIHDLVASLFKTKLDEAHRIVDTIKSVLMTRMQEQKFMNTSAAEDPDSYKTIQQINDENSRRI